MADAAQDVDASAGSLDTAKDLFAGAAGGIAQVLIGQFDFHLDIEYLPTQPNHRIE